MVLLCNDKVGRKDIGSLEYVSCIIKDRLYFALAHGLPLSLGDIHAFTIDDELVYENFYADFGPYNIAQLYRYCRKLNRKLKNAALIKKTIIHCTSYSISKRTNAAFLVGAYQILFLNRVPDEAYKCLLFGGAQSFLPYRDAAFGPSSYNLNLIDCLHAVSKASKFGLLNLDKFNLEEYEYYEKVENGDLSWILPDKLIAFCGPNSQSGTHNEYPTHTPEFYLPFFRKNNVTTIIRLNKRTYDASRFEAARISHYDLFFPDGSVPTEHITRQFLEITEKAEGVVAVHCKAGLGRTGTLIACYLMKHYHFSAPEAIAWVRICRPGSIIGRQQNWLQEQQSWCWNEGQLLRGQRGGMQFNAPSSMLSERLPLISNSSDFQTPNSSIISPPLPSTALLRSDFTDNLETNLSKKIYKTLTSDGRSVYHHKIQIPRISVSDVDNVPKNRYDSTVVVPSPAAVLSTSDNIVTSVLRTDCPIVHTQSRAFDQGNCSPTLTQGDQLNRIKLLRKRVKSHGLQDNWQENNRTLFSREPSPVASSFPRGCKASALKSEDPLLQSYDLAIPSAIQLEDAAYAKFLNQIETNFLANVAQNSRSVSPKQLRTREFGDFKLSTNASCNKNLASTPNSVKFIPIDDNWRPPMRMAQKTHTVVKKEVSGDGPSALDELNTTRQSASSFSRVESSSPHAFSGNKPCKIENPLSILRGSLAGNMSHRTVRFGNISESSYNDSDSSAVVRQPAISVLFTDPSAKPFRNETMSPQPRFHPTASSSFVDVFANDDCNKRYAILPGRKKVEFSPLLLWSNVSGVDQYPTSFVPSPARELRSSMQSHQTSVAGYSPSNGAVRRLSPSSQNKCRSTTLKPANLVRLSYPPANRLDDSPSSLTPALHIKGQ